MILQMWEQIVEFLSDFWEWFCGSPSRLYVKRHKKDARNFRNGVGVSLSFNAQKFEAELDKVKLRNFWGMQVNDPNLQAHLNSALSEALELEGQKIKSDYEKTLDGYSQDEIEAMTSCTSFTYLPHSKAIEFQRKPNRPNPTINHQPGTCQREGCNNLPMPGAYVCYKHKEARTVKEQKKRCGHCRQLNGAEELYCKCCGAEL